MKYPQILSMQAAPEQVSYSRKQSIMYALGVGAGQDSLDTEELNFVYEENLIAFPTMATTLLGRSNRFIDEAGLDFSQLLHSEQRLTIHNRLPAEGCVTVKSACIGVSDKGRDKGAVVHLQHDILDTDGKLEIATLIVTLFCRGDGGFGETTGTIPGVHRVPERLHDRLLELATLPNQAAIYRLAIGDTNPLHIDPAFAQRLGFQGPLLHGLCTYGFVCRGILREYCDYDTSLIRSFDARFASPVYPGETLQIKLWQDGNTISFECYTKERGTPVLTHGRCELNQGF